MQILAISSLVLHIHLTILHLFDISTLPWQIQIHVTQYLSSRYKNNRYTSASLHFHSSRRMWTLWQTGIKSIPLISIFTDAFSFIIWLNPKQSWICHMFGLHMTLCFWFGIFYFVFLFQMSLVSFPESIIIDRLTKQRLISVNNDLNPTSTQKHTLYTFDHTWTSRLPQHPSWNKPIEKICLLLIRE